MQIKSIIFIFVIPNKNKFISMKPDSNLNHFQQPLFHTIPPPLDHYNLFWSYKKQAPKPLLGRQNWVTLTGRHHNLVPRLATERWPSAWSAMWFKHNLVLHHTNTINLSYISVFQENVCLELKAFHLEYRNNQYFC